MIRTKHQLGFWKDFPSSPRVWVRSGSSEKLFQHSVASLPPGVQSLAQYYQLLYEPSLQAFVQSYRKKRKGGMLCSGAPAASPATTSASGPPSAAPAIDDNLGSDADTPNKTPSAAKRTPATTTTTMGNTFFGPDFSPEDVLRGDGSQGRHD